MRTVRRGRSRVGARDVPARSASECKSALGRRPDVLTQARLLRAGTSRGPQRVRMQKRAWSQTGCPHASVAAAGRDVPRSALPGDRVMTASWLQRLRVGTSRAPGTSRRQNQTGQRTRRPVNSQARRPRYFVIGLAIYAQITRSVDFARAVAKVECS
jgi:hypothetical protein